MSELVAASGLNFLVILSTRSFKTNKFSTHYLSSLKKNIDEITVTLNVSFQPSVVLNQPGVLKYCLLNTVFQFSLTFLQNINFH